MINQIASKLGQKYKMCLLLGIMLSSFCSWAQVSISVKLKTSSKEKLYAAVYSDGDEQLHPIFGNKIDLQVQQYEEYIIAFFQKKSIPQFLSIHTNASNPNLNLQLSLAAGQAKQEDYAPSSRYSSSGKKGFDLDQIENKAAFAFQMGSAGNAIRNFYESGQLPRIKTIRKTSISLENIRKTEHKLGQDLYLLLQRKQWLEKHLEQIQSLLIQDNKVDDAQFCTNELKYLKIEGQLVETKFKMSAKELERVKLRNNKAIKTGQTPSKSALQNAQQKFEENQKRQAIAILNLKNKQADCWAYKKQLTLNRNRNFSESDKQIQQIAISNIRLKQRQDNAVNLYKQHNALASTLTGRARIESLANAQKYAFDQAATKVYQSQNNLRKWQLKDRASGKYASDIRRSSLLLQKRRDMAYEAEMSYLEHMWHLRDKSTFGERETEDLFNRQSGLLRIAAPPQWILPNADASDEEILAKAAIVTEERQGDQIIRRVRFPNDYYEIIINAQQVKRYNKNQKPISYITYRFETIKKFGEYLNNIRVEESRKSWLVELFKKRIF